MQLKNKLELMSAYFQLLLFWISWV